VNISQAYQTLQVESDTPFEEIKYSYRKLVLDLHPDKNKNQKDGFKFKQVTEAYHFLKNNHKRLVSKERSNQKYKTKTTKNNFSFSGKDSAWRAPPGGKTPEEDWGRFTKEFEEGNPNFWKEYEKRFWEEYEIKQNKKDGDPFEKTKESKNQPNLLVDVDPTLCIGCCSCETIAPEVFVVDRNSKMNPKSHVYDAKGAGINKIMNAAETCPTKAIKVEDKDAKKILFPW